MTSNAQKDTSVAILKGENPIVAFQDEMNRLFQSFFGETLPHWWHASESCMSFGMCPATDITETDKDFKVTVELPGLDAKDITVSVNEGFITVKGKKETEEKKENKGYFRQERYFGEFQRVIALPSDVANTEKVDATVSKGVLTITVPKKANAQPKSQQIEVKQVA